MTQYTHRDTGVTRKYCGCQNKLTSHSVAGVCQWCGNTQASIDFSETAVIRLDRKGQPVREGQP